MRPTHTIGEALKVISNMEYFTRKEGSPTYLWLVRYLQDNPRKLDVFVDFPNDYTRMKFIQSEHVAAMIMAQAKPNPYGIPPPLDPFPSDFY